MEPRFALRRGHHAINEFHASLHFVQPVSPLLFSKLLALVEKIANRENLPAPLNRQMIQFNMGLGAQIPTQVNSVGYQRFSINGENDLSLFVDASSIIVESSNYQGWAIMSKFLSTVFSEIASLFLSEMPLVRSIAIQYQNEFRAIDKATISPVEIFKTGSPWLAPFYNGSRDIWHCHIGEFQPISENNRNLIQVNTDIVNQRVFPTNQEYLFAKIGITTASNYDIVGQSPLILELDSLNVVILRDLDRLHDLAKSIARDVFSKQYIGLMNVG